MKNYTLISHIIDNKLPTKVIVSNFITYIEAHNINGDYKLGIHQDPLEIDLVPVTTPAGKIGLIKLEEAQGILDCLEKYYEGGGDYAKII